MKRIFVLFVSALMSFCTCAQDGDIEQMVRHGSWLSYKLCGFDGCVWRAVSNSYRHGSTFTIDCYPDGYKFFIMSSLNEESRKSWEQGDSDEIQARVRIDYNPIINTVFERNYYRTANVLFSYFNMKDFDSLFLNQLKQGKTLRVQLLYPSGEEYTMSFSLNGSAKALNRVRTKILKQKTSDEKFFPKQE